MGTRKGDRTRGGTRSGDAGTATASLETHITQNAYTVGVTELWPQAEFPTVPASQLHLGVHLLLSFLRGGGLPRPLLFPLF